MHGLFDAVFSAFVRLEGWTSDLAGMLAGLGHRATQPGELAMASIVVASLLVCVFGCAWALVERARAGAAQYRATATLARAQSEIRFREAMIQAVPEAVVVMGSDLTAPLSYRGGSALLQACLAGADSVPLAARLAALLEGGASFAIVVRTASHPAVSIQGTAVGSRAALFLRIEEGATELEHDMAEVLESLAVPVWIRSRKLALVWANRAFLAATGIGSLDNARNADPRLVRAERDLVSAALEGNDVLGERRYAVVEGRRRALSVDFTRLASGCVAGVALDVTESAQAEAQLRLTADATAGVLDQVDTAVAVFGVDRRLAVANARFAQLWDLPLAWLDTGPTLDDLFDRLRETRQLPEQRDYQGWKREHVRLFEGDDGTLDETWHVAGGSSIRVRARPYLLGGVAYVFDDISERLRLATSLNMLSKTQRATLDAIADGMAVFGADGRLKMHNDAFAELWRFSEDELAFEPHMARIAAVSTAKFGQDSVWSMVTSGIASGEPARYGEWGRVTRADGRILSVSLTRLPLGATLAVFEDLTDIERFNAAMHGEAA